MSTLLVMWFRSANSHTGQQLSCITGRTDGSIRLLAKPHRYRLQPKGRPQMESSLSGLGRRSPVSGHSFRQRGRGSNASGWLIADWPLSKGRPR